MAPRTPTPHSSDSDSDAPEALSFNSSKRAARDTEDSVAQAQRAQRQRQRQRNRERDAALKRRKEQARARAAAAPDSEPDGDEAASGGARDDLQTRMERAMREAAEESGGDADMGSGDGDGDGGEDADEAMLAEDGGGDSDSDSEMAEPPPKPAQSKSKYLPDHLFHAAFAAPPRPKTQPAHAPPAARPQKRRKRTSRSAKDILVGSKTIRTLPSPAEPVHAAARTLVPPAPARRFVRTSLNESGTPARAKAKGWERRPANLGVMRRDGPAASFARGS